MPNAPGPKTLGKPRPKPLRADQGLNSTCREYKIFQERLKTAGVMPKDQKRMIF